MAGLAFRAVSASSGFGVALGLGGCALQGAPSFALAGAFFPAWMLCAAVGVAAALAARALFVVTGLAEVLPLQLFVCTAIGVCVALASFLLVFGR